MSLDRNSLGPDVLGRVDIYGVPFHGTVQGNVLTLPNATTKAWPQPNGDWPDEAGTTHRVKRPGQPDIVRTLDEQTADTAAGYQWRNTAMLSGYRRQLYSKSLFGWIYIDPAGDRWIVEITTNLNDTTFDFTASLTLAFKISRFGEFSPGLTSFTTQSQTLTDWGQQGYPDLPGFQTTTGTGIETITGARLLVDGIFSDGSKASVCVHRRRTVSDDGRATLDHAIRHPLGWLQIAITGLGSAPTISLSVLKNRAQTIIEVARTVTPAYSSTNIQPNDPGIILSAGIGTYTFNFEFTRLAAIVPNAADNGWRYYSVRVKHSGVGTGAVSGGGLSYTGSSSGTVSERYAIELDDVELYAIASSQVYERLYTFEFNNDLPNRIVQTDLGLTITLTFQGVDYVQSPSGPGAPVIEEGVSYSPGLVPSTGSQYLTEKMQIMVTSLAEFFFTTQINAPGPYQLTADFRRYCGKVFGLSYRMVSGPTSGPTVDDVTHLPRVRPLMTPTGAEVVRAYSLTERMYASFDPHTEALADIQTAPICFV